MSLGRARFPDLLWFGPPRAPLRPPRRGSPFYEKFLVMRHLLFWAGVTAIIATIVAIQFEFEYGAALQRMAEVQIGR